MNIITNVTNNTDRQVQCDRPLELIKLEKNITDVTYKGKTKKHNTDNTNEETVTNTTKNIRNVTATTLIDRSNEPLAIY